VIRDPQGGYVSGATVTLSSQETGARRSAASDARGEFTITAVPPGEYRLEAQHQGFVKYAQALTMEVNSGLHMEIGMARLGTDTIEVSGVAPLVRTESSAMGGVIDNRQILGLPLDGRNFYERKARRDRSAAPSPSASTERARMRTTFCWMEPTMAIPS
jgi:hypothetical protein